MSSEFHPLSSTDYASSSDNCSMDEVSLASRHGGGSVSSSSHRHIANGRSALISSGASVSSAFSRSSRRAMKKSSELGVPLTSSMNEDEEEFYNDNGDSSSTAAAAAPITSSSMYCVSSQGFQPYKITR